MWEGVFDQIKQILGKNLRTPSNPRQTSVPILEISPPTFFYFFRIWKLGSKMSDPKTPKLKYLSVADLVSTWDFLWRIATCENEHRPTCRSNRIAAKPKDQKIEKLQKKGFRLKCLGELIRRVLKLCITSLSGWGPSEHGSACVWSPADPFHV